MTSPIPAGLPRLQEPIGQNRVRQHAVQEESVGMQDLLRVLLRRRRWVMFFVVAGLLCGILLVVISPRMYLSQAKVQLLKQDAGGSLSDAMAASSGGIGDALDFNLTLQTQVDVLKSDKLALEVIDQLNLEKNDPDFVYHSWTKPLGAAERVVPLNESPARRRFVLNVFHRRLKVDSLSGTRLIGVQFEDRSPQRAQEVVNALVKAFTENNIEDRYEATSNAADWLKKKLDTLHADVASAQKNAADLQRNSGLYGTDESHNIVTARLEQLNQQLVMAQSVFVMKQAIFQAAQREGNGPELVAGLIDTGTVNSGLNPTVAVLQGLRQQESEATARLAELRSRLGDKYPTVLAEQGRLDTLKHSIADEVNKMRERAGQEYQIARTALDAAQSALDRQKAEATKLNDRSIDFLISKQEADSKRNLYQLLTSKMLEASILAGLHSSDIRVVDPANVPDRASKPDVIVDVSIATVLGFLLGIILAFVVDSLDRSLRNYEEVEQLTGAAVLGLVPTIPAADTGAERSQGDAGASPPAHKYDYVVRNPNSIIAETFRTIRTAIQLSSPASPPQVIMLTSGSPAEGKSFCTMNLASAFAQSGRRVLVIDGDLRKGNLTRMLGPSASSPGLSALLSSGSMPEGLTGPSKQNGLYVLGRGPRPPYPSELLASAQMAKLLAHLRTRFDFIFIDTPPVLPVTDAVSLSNMVDGVIVITRSGKTSKSSLTRVFRLLNSTRCQKLGVILNGLDARSPDYYYYAGNYAYGYKNAYAAGPQFQD